MYSPIQFHRISQSQLSLCRFEWMDLGEYAIQVVVEMCRKSEVKAVADRNSNTDIA